MDDETPKPDPALFADFTSPMQNNANSLVEWWRALIVGGMPHEDADITLGTWLALATRPEAEEQ